MAEPGDSIVDVLRRRARHHADRPFMSYLARGERVEDQSSYAEMDRAARVVAGRLREAGLGGRPVLIALPSGLDFVRCFFGALYAGVLAVPVPLPAQRRARDRIRAIAASAGAAAVLMAKGTIDDPNASEISGELPVIAAEEALAGPACDLPTHADLDGIAFIQYTSGSTGNPKGVVVTHRNIMANQAMIQAVFGNEEASVGVSWLPLHHDMGLIGCVIQPLYVGARMVLMSPLAFLQKPVRWLRAIEEHGATNSGSPNFGYELCLRQITDAQCRGLDLSRWRLAFCGSEPVRPRTMERFAARFAPFGFDPAALYACYGLAEATLLVTGGCAGAGIAHRRVAGAVQATVSCGKPAPGCEIALVGPDGGLAAAGETGEICVRGEHVSPGFWSARDSAIVADAGRQCMIEDRRFLRTGDLGSIVEGELHVVGRIKDMLIVRGMNLYAEDVEETVAQSPEAAGIAASAAFGVETEYAERLVLVCELERGRALPADPDPIRDLVRRVISDDHGVMPADVAIVASGSISRSSGGKVQRAATRERYLAGEFGPVGAFLANAAEAVAG